MVDNNINGGQQHQWWTTTSMVDNNINDGQQHQWWITTSMVYNYISGGQHWMYEDLIRTSQCRHDSRPSERRWHHVTTMIAIAIISLNIFLKVVVSDSQEIL